MTILELRLLYPATLSSTGTASGYGLLAAAAITHLLRSPKSIDDDFTSRRMNFFHFYFYALMFELRHAVVATTATTARRNYRACIGKKLMPDVRGRC